jgi:excisionase family DNA binding protein
VTTVEAAESLGIASRSVVAAIKRGKLAAIQYGRSWIIEPSEVERYRREDLGKVGKRAKKKNKKLS